MPRTSARVLGHRRQASARKADLHVAGYGFRFASLQPGGANLVVSRTSRQVDAASSLALAVVASSNTPLLLLAGDLTVIAASTSFCTAFGIDPAEVAHRQLAALGAGEWNSPKLASLLSATAAGAAEIHAYEMDLERPGSGLRHLVVNAHKLDYEDKDQVRLLLGVLDVTELRANEKQKDDLIRDKAILLREVQHRIANSLQIIASVLMQSARRVQSDETRLHLKDAHSRVMSIASVQRQLAESSVEDVALRPYFIQLCGSLGASMIEDSSRLSIEVSVDDSVTSPDTSVSLGLIVTELVINALKHAFPGGRGGKILVDYHTYGPNWTLSVSDDGVGMSTDPALSKPGLGTSIVEALANQLEADVQIRSTMAGTSVAITHTKIAAVHRDAVASNH
jgi:two-component sensor histidine kinase